MATYKSVLYYPLLRGGCWHSLFTDAEEALQFIKVHRVTEEGAGFCLVAVTQNQGDFHGKAYFAVPLPPERTEPEAGILLPGDTIIARLVSVAARWQHV